MRGHDMVELVEAWLEHGIKKDALPPKTPSKYAHIPGRRRGPGKNNKYKTAEERLKAGNYRAMMSHRRSRAKQKHDDLH